jgi:histone demethylase JARID1
MIPEMKTFHPTEEHFTNPIAYMEWLETNESISQYGVIKIVPPPSFKPPLCFERSSG